MMAEDENPILSNISSGDGAVTTRRDYMHIALNLSGRDKIIPDDSIQISSGEGAVTTRRDYLRIALNLSGCILQVVAGYLPQLGVGRRIGNTPYTVKSQPAGVAFSIWGLIFPLCIMYGIYQALPGQHTNPLLRRIGTFSAVAFYETIQWSLIAILAAPADDDIRGNVVYEWILSLTLFYGIATPLNYILYTLLQNYDNKSRSVISQKEYFFVVLPLSIFAAWTTLASFVNIAGALLVSGVYNFDRTNRGQGGTVAYLCCVGVLIAALIFTYKGLLPFSCVVIWAYAWIAQVNFAFEYGQVGVTASVFTVLFAFVVLGSKWWWARKSTTK